MTRQVLYLTGTRADFGLMLATLRAIDETPGLSLQLCVTGMHLSTRYGHTVAEVEDSGLPIVARVPAEVDHDSPYSMARASAQVMQGFTTVLSKTRPDVVLLLGDRSEMLAGAMCAMLSGIPVAHLCGGERSGTVDDSMRHAISKLAHLHLVATEESRQRLLRMGEEDHRIHVVGTPGLVGLRALGKTYSRAELLRRFQLEARRPLAVVLFHPVVQEASHAGEQCETLLNAIESSGYAAICLMPNADSGNAQIRDVMERRAADSPTLRLVTHLPRPVYVSLLSCADLLIGNSSSGIIEAATFGLPVVNVGDRQRSRERNANVFDTDPTASNITAAIHAAAAYPRSQTSNLYGDGKTDEHVARLLATLPLGGELLKKTATY